MKIVFLTSNSERHKFVANLLGKNFETSVVFEPKNFWTRAKKFWYLFGKNEILSQYFWEMDKTEKVYFLFDEVYSSSFSTKDGKPFDDFKGVLKIRNGQINSDKVYDFISKRNPDFVVLFGSGIVGERILNNFRVINLHLGLSPHYRGVATNFWPLVDGLPECVGASIHRAVKAVDAGEIYSQVRPKIEKDYSNHQISCETIMSGAIELVEVLKHFDEIKPQRQEKKGKLCKRKDFNFEAVEKLNHNLEQGMIEKYLLDKDQRDAKYPIVSR